MWIPMILLIILMLYYHHASAVAAIVTLNSYITANSTNSTWLSPSGEFAFGFQQVVPGGYLLAIWFNRIPERTIVWSANRDSLAPEGSRIQIFQNRRQFGLVDPTGTQIWQPANVASAIDHGEMLDTGNFVLSGNSLNTLLVWQSFDEPTNTLLPSQTLHRGAKLVASLSPTNYSRGRFMLILQDNGDLVLSTRSFPLDDPDTTYWSSATPGTNSQLIFNQSGQVYLATENQTILTTLFSNSTNQQLYQRIVLEYDGVVKYYTHGDSSWDFGTSYLPTDICDTVHDDGKIGAGACGLNSFCSYGPDRNIPICNCPKGYSWVDSTDRFGGCKPDFVPQSCQFDESESFTFVELQKTNFPFYEYAVFKGVNTDWCRRSCLEDCFCSAVVMSTDCYKKKFPLSFGRTNSRVVGTTMVKIRINGTSVPNSTGKGSNNGNGKHDRGLIITVCVILATSLLVNLLLSSAMVFLARGRNLSNKNEGSYKTLQLRCFSFREMEAATNGFNEQLGRGAFSIVYKGVLKDDNGRMVAVKKLKKVELEQEFISEIISIGKTNHRNLVHLIGYCDDDQNKLLVYEFMSNGSLADLLFRIGSSPPRWGMRVQIAIATAKGLHYLHEECSSQIIHCDIKPQNVLLDASYGAKIADFGIAKLLMPDQTRTSTMARGTTGYMAPEWLRRGRITTKVDVYSFGVMLLELVCCRKSYEVKDDSETGVILFDYAYWCCEKGKLYLLAMEDDGTMDDIERFEKFVMVAIWCMQEDPTMRPTMKMVVNMLEGFTEVPLPHL